MLPYTPKNCLLFVLFVILLLFFEFLVSYVLCPHPVAAVDAAGSPDGATEEHLKSDKQKQREKAKNHGRDPASTQLDKLLRPKPTHLAQDPPTRNPCPPLHVNSYNRSLRCPCPTQRPGPDKDCARIQARKGFAAVPQYNPKLTKTALKGSQIT